jgi:SAM-dependent methyltransferase
MGMHERDVLTHANVAEASHARYTSEAVLPVYLHAEWGDLLAPNASGTALLHGSELPGSYYREAGRLISGWLDEAGLVVSSACDVGAGTGRLVREISLRITTALSVTALEPSPIFCAWARSLLLGEPFVGPVPLPGTALASRHVHIPAARRPEPVPRVTVVQAEAEDLVRSGARFDLVTCMNVLDRVPRPRRMIDTLAQVVDVGGMVVVACPFDFRHEYSPQEEWFHDVRDVLDPSSWDVVGVAELPYAFLQHDRLVNRHVSQLVAAERR